MSGGYGGHCAWEETSIPSLPSWMVSKQFVEFPAAQSVDLAGLESYPIPHDSDWFRNGHVTKERFSGGHRGSAFSLLRESNGEADAPLMIATGSHPTAPRGTALGLNWHCGRQCGRWKDAESLMTSLNFLIYWSWSPPLLPIFLPYVSWRITLLYKLVSVDVPIAYSWKHSNAKGLRKN